MFICKAVAGYAVIVYMCALLKALSVWSVSPSICLSVDVLQMMEDFSGLALPPLFGGHILEAELETGGVELGPSGSELLEDDEAPSGPAQDEEDERRELDKSKYHTLSKRCKEIEQVNTFTLKCSVEEWLHCHSCSKTLTFFHEKQKLSF